MATALGLARRSLGAAWPNPSVGCLLVKYVGDAPTIVGRGYTAPGGRPHAETEALGQAGSLANGATAYVTLEPCAHHGQTPPCAEALARAGIGRAVVAVSDPDPRVSGAGFEMMRAAGIDVEVGLLREEALDVNAGFFTRVSENRPLVTLKLATSLDGRIATADGDSQWITGKRARAWVHGLRARNDAVVIGIGTALSDDPLLTCRLPGMADRSPVRVIFDSELRLPQDSQLVVDAEKVRLIVITAAEADKSAPQSVGGNARGGDGDRPRSTWTSQRRCRHAGACRSGLYPCFVRRRGALSGGIHRSWYRRSNCLVSCTHFAWRRRIAVSGRIWRGTGV